MGVLDGVTSTIYRYTPDGRRIYQLRRLAPERYWRTYHITDAVVGRFERRFRRVITSTFGLLIFMPIVYPRSSDGDDLLPATIAGVAVLLVMEALMRLWVLRGIERINIRPDELVAVNRREREITYLRATGMTTLVAMLVAGLLMALIAAVSIAETDKTGPVMGTTLFSILAISIARQIYVLQRANRQQQR